LRVPRVVAENAATMTAESRSACTPEDIRLLLSGLPRAALIEVPEGYCAILRDRVDDDQVSVEDVDAWVIANGGAQRRTNNVRSRPDQFGKTRLTAKAYYVIPLSALGDA
jgi:hypothetical protein